MKKVELIIRIGIIFCLFFGLSYVKNHNFSSVEREKKPVTFYKILEDLFFVKAEAKKKEKVRKKAEKKSFYDSKSVKRIHSRRAKRLDEINNYKSSMHIGESEDGLIKIKTTSNLTKKEMKKLEQLVEFENNDRNKLYAIVMKEDGFRKDQEPVLRLSMFQTNLAKDPNGTYYFQEHYWRKK